MGRKKIVEQTSEELEPIRRAIDPRVRENQMIALSENLAEKQLRDGTASAQVICHYLKLGTVEKQLELEKLKNENALLAKKVEVLESAKDTQELYTEVIRKMQIYSGHVPEEE